VSERINDVTVEEFSQKFIDGGIVNEFMLDGDIPIVVIAGVKEDVGRYIADNIYIHRDDALESIDAVGTYGFFADVKDDVSKVYLFITDFSSEEFLTELFLLFTKAVNFIYSTNERFSECDETDMNATTIHVMSSYINTLGIKEDNNE